MDPNELLARLMSALSSKAEDLQAAAAQAKADDWRGPLQSAQSRLQEVQADLQAAQAQAEQAAKEAGPPTPRPARAPAAPKAPKPAAPAAAAPADDPFPPGPLIRLDAPKTAPIVARFALSDKAAGCSTELKPRAFLECLVDKKSYDDAVRFLCHGLPKRDAILWAGLCLRELHHPADLPEGHRHAWRAAVAWVLDPREEKRRAGQKALEAVGASNPAGCMALGVFMSGGSISSSATEVPPPAGACAQAASVAILMAASSNAARRDQVCRDFLRVGVMLAMQHAALGASDQGPAKACPDHPGEAEVRAELVALYRRLLADLGLDRAAAPAAVEDGSVANMDDQDWSASSAGQPAQAGDDWPAETRTTSKKRSKKTMPPTRPPSSDDDKSIGGSWDESSWSEED